MTSSCVASGLRRQTLVRKVIILLAIAGTALTAIGTLPRAVAAAESSLLHSTDLSPILQRSGLTLRSQGSRNTCSVFVVAGALECALAQRTGSGRRLSVEFLNWASNDAIGRTADGGYFSDLWKGFEAHGICEEEDWPYRDAFDPELEPSELAKERAREVRDLGFRWNWIKPWNPHTGLTDAEFDMIRQALGRDWPVCAGMRWPKAERWENHVLAMAPPEGVRDGHSVLLIGYEDSPNWPGGGRFLIRNSNRGGRDNFLTYEYARAYINDAAWIDYEPEETVAPASPVFSGFQSPVAPGPIGRNRRVSSNQQPGWNSENLDMTWLMPGESVEMPVLEGPGVITHIWLTSHAGWVGELNALSLRIFWDGRQEPGVEVPVGDFFAVGQGKPASVESIPVQVSPSGSLSCYWRMPFHQSARIIVTNDNPDRSTGLYWQVNWTQVDELPIDTPHFHARYRCEHPAVAGRDYLIADLEGQGQYVGTVLSVTLAQDGWFGEGDDFFYIDGEATPSLQGTGTEDYFNDAWGFRPRTGPWCGQPRWQGNRTGDSGVCYRWHLPDPVNFTRSLKLTMEHKGNRPVAEDGFFLERPDFWSSVAFWYQTGDPKPFAQLPAWHQRRVPWQSRHFVRAFRQATATSDTPLRVETLGFFGARPLLLWQVATPDAALTVPFEVAEKGRYAVRLTAAHGPDYGAFDIRIDGQSVLMSDFRAPEFAEADIPLGTHELESGVHDISFHAAADADQVGFLAVELLRLLALPPEARRTVRTHHEAHFVRLGIGRAIYAYRLAYDRLPDSLEVLVETGIMPDRYLKDENGRPLRSGREGDYLVVESTAPDGWTHRWQGLDPRR